MSKTLARTRGVSLIEALVAMAVMAFGMLALVGVQATMRMNNDLSKQRTEATRIATEEIERLRGFLIRDADNTAPGTSWEEIDSRSLDGYSPPDGIGNATYQVTRTVRTDAATVGLRKIVSVVVQWTDRTGTSQSVTLDSVIAGYEPVLAGVLLAPTPPSATNLSGGRHTSIPSAAVDQGNGTSSFAPPGARSITWVFNNLTGVITSRCVSGTCTDIQGLLLAGTVWFDLSRNPSSRLPQGPALPLDSSQPMYFEANPTTSSNATVDQKAQSRAPECYAASPAQPDNSVLSVPYFCLVYPTSLDTGYGGKFDVALASQYPDGSDLYSGKDPSDFKVCRYTSDSSDFTINIRHPKTYCMEQNRTPTVASPCRGLRVNTNLTNQNFLVIATSSCPSTTDNTNLVNYRTLNHMPQLPQ